MNVQEAFGAFRDYFNDAQRGDQVGAAYVRLSTPELRRLAEAAVMLRSAFPSGDLDEIDDDKKSGRRRLGCSFTVTIADLRKYDTALASFVAAVERSKT